MFFSPMCFPNKFACNSVSILNCEWVYMNSHCEPQMIALFYWAIGPSIFFGTSFDWPCAAKNGTGGQISWDALWLWQFNDPGALCIRSPGGKVRTETGDHGFTIGSTITMKIFQTVRGCWCLLWIVPCKAMVITAGMDMVLYVSSLTFFSFPFFQAPKKKCNRLHAVLSFSPLPPPFTGERQHAARFPLMDIDFRQSCKSLWINMLPSSKLA